ncbi:hypothetical protein ScalyP_jg4071 [Parmales sp. scaly parma]|nr:hypothetical protein ScalyP_jg4071 [Parmales sp. scaly parma]
MLSHHTLAEQLVSNAIYLAMPQHSFETDADTLNVVFSRSRVYLVEDADQSQTPIPNPPTPVQNIPELDVDPNDMVWLNSIRSSLASTSTIVNAENDHDQSQSQSQSQSQTSSATVAGPPVIINSTPNPTPRQPRLTPFGRVPLGNINQNTLSSSTRSTTKTTKKLKKLVAEKDEEIFKLRSQLASLSVANPAPALERVPVLVPAPVPATVFTSSSSNDQLATPGPKKSAACSDSNPKPIFSEFDDDIENECPLCMSPLKKKKFSKGDGNSNDAYTRYTVITHCGHCFHLDCLQRTRNFDMSNCPMCREDLPPGITPAKKGKEVVPQILANRAENHVPPRYVAPNGNQGMNVFNGNGGNNNNNNERNNNERSNNERNNNNNNNNEENEIVVGRRSFGVNMNRSRRSNRVNGNEGHLRVNSSSSKACVIS